MVIYIVSAMSKRLQLAPNSRPPARLTHELVEANAPVQFAREVPTHKFDDEINCGKQYEVRDLCRDV